MSAALAQVYTDFNGLQALRTKARENKEAALDEVTRQFESLFMQMMLKSMREASFGGGLLDSKQSDYYRDMYDKQLAVNLSEQQGIGLSEMLKRQLGGEQLTARTGMTVEDYNGQAVLTVAKPDDAKSVDDKTQRSLGGSPETFLEALWPSAEKAAARLNLAPEALLAQAALETGWGRHVMSGNSGGSSHNLFGIKTGRRWDGDQVEVSTLEYKDGVALQTRAGFRAYDSFDASFDDYVSFVRDNPRYADALAVSDDAKAYFRELQKAGYATDPAYADKIARILDSDAMRAVRSKVEGADAG
jgi:peptidoglycan hydrolase FlgJ